MRKLNKKVLQFGCYVDDLNLIRHSLNCNRISQADFAAYLRLDTKSLSDILNGITVPNAALFSYMTFLFSDGSAYSVLMNWIGKFGRSSFSHFRSRKLSLIELPE